MTHSCAKGRSNVLLVIPPRHIRILEDVSYPESSRYTLQWLIHPPNKSTERQIPNNTNATFKNHDLHKPADLILHYHYGTAAVANWSRNTDVLERPGNHHPQIPTPASMGPKKTLSDHSASIDKHEKCKRDSDKTEGNSQRSGQSGTKQQERDAKQPREEENRESFGWGTWDADDVMLHFWANSQAARERHAQEEEERNEGMEKWRSGVSAEPV